MSERKSRALRVGLFGLLGSGNIGNDSSVEAIMRWLQAERPDAVIDAKCMGWERIRSRYGIESTPIQWQDMHRLPGGPLDAGLKAVGKVLDVFHTAAWVRGHDVVIVPGMGMFDATLPLNPWGMPWALLQLAVAGRLLGTTVALVSVGATSPSNPVTARLYRATARLVRYRSFRDESSRDVLLRLGADTARDPIYPDLVFSLGGPDEPAIGPGVSGRIDTLAVGVGVMSYYGSGEDRGRAGEIYSSYVSAMKAFVGWLVDSGRHVRLFVGDECDQPVVDEIITCIRSARPGLDSSRLEGLPVTTFAEVTRLIAPVSAVVATRFHSIVLSLLMGKPVISIGYSPKNDSLMEDLGLQEFTQHAREVDVDRLKRQFAELESRHTEITSRLATLIPRRSELSRGQLDELTTVLFG